MKNNSDLEKWDRSVDKVLEQILQTPPESRLKLTGTDPDWHKLIHNIPIYPYRGHTGMWFILDQQFCIEETDKATLQTLGMEPGALKGIPFAALLSENSCTEWDSSIRPHLLRDSATLCKILDFRYIVSTPALCFFSPALINKQVFVLVIEFIPTEYITAQNLIRSGRFGEIPYVEKGTPNQKQTRDEKRIREVAEYISNHLDGSLPSIEKLAPIFGMNQQKLKMEFKYFFGQTIYDFYDDKRMEKAGEYLCHTKMCNAEIAEKLGFKSHSAFYRAFRRKYGCTPGTYRKKHLS